MKKLILVSSIIIQSCIAFAQNYCENDTIVREIQFPLTEQDTETIFFYFNYYCPLNPKVVSPTS